MEMYAVSSRKMLYFGVYGFDRSSRSLSRNGSPIALQEHPAKLLGLLLEFPGQVVSRERIRQVLWPDDAFGEFEAGINTTVSKLRSALHDSPSRPVYIETVPRIGYRFAAPILSNDEPGLPVPAAHSLRRPWIWVAAAAAALGIGAWQWRTFADREAIPALLELRPLTTLGGEVGRPVLSPDGNSVAFDWNGPKRDNVDIYIMPVAGDTPVRMTTDPAIECWASFSPDGSKFAFVRLTGDTTASIYIKPVLGGHERFFAKLSRGHGDRPSLNWSPDGKWLVSSERERAGEPGNLVLLDVASGGRRALTERTPKTLGDAEAVFSPDSKWIAFRRTISSAIEDVFVIGVTGGNPRQVTFDNRGIKGIAWSHDAESLLVSTSRRGNTAEIWRFPIHGGDPRRLTSPAIEAGSPTVARDGKKIVIVNSAVDTNVWEVALPVAAAPRPVILSSRLDGGAVFSPDGARIAFRSTRSGADEIWVCERDGSNQRRLTEFGRAMVGGARWSPDGRRLAFDGRSRTDSDVYLIDADGTGLDRFIAGDSNDHSPNFSGDGKYLYFASDRSGSLEVWRKPFDGGAAEQITQGGGYVPVEAPGGKLMYYSRRDPPSVFVLPLDGKSPVEGKRVVEVPNGTLGQWAVTGAGLYFLANDKSFPDPWRIRMIPHGTDTARDMGPLPRQAIAIDGRISVSADDRSMLLGLVDRSGSDLLVADLK